jgi:hypothetical protein
VDVVQEGCSSKLGVNWRARLIVPTGKNSKHLAYLSLLTVSRNTRRGNKKNKVSGNQSSTLLEVRIDWSKTELRLRVLCFENCVFLSGG